MSIYVERAGSGEPLLLVHGLGGVCRYWDPLLGTLTAKYDVLTVDLPGFGHSPPLSGPTVSAADIAAAVAGLLDELNLPDVHVVGHSLGGVVAFELAALGRARSVVGLAPAGLWAAEEQDPRSRARLRFSHGVAAGTRPLARPLVRVASHLPLPRPRGMSAGALLALYDSYSSAPGFMPVLRGVGSTPFTKKEQVTVPVTVVFGSRDTVILARDRSRTRLPPHTRWIELSGAGHNVPWERPKDIIQAVAETVSATIGGPHAPPARH